MQAESTYALTSQALAADATQEAAAADTAAGHAEQLGKKVKSLADASGKTATDPAKQNELDAALRELAMAQAALDKAGIARAAADQASAALLAFPGATLSVIVRDNGLPLATIALQRGGPLPR